MAAAGIAAVAGAALVLPPQFGGADDPARDAAAPATTHPLVTEPGAAPTPAETESADYGSSDSVNYFRGTDEVEPAEDSIDYFRGTDETADAEPADNVPGAINYFSGGDEPELVSVDGTMAGLTRVEVPATVDPADLQCMTIGNDDPATATIESWAVDPSDGTLSAYVCMAKAPHPERDLPASTLGLVYDVELQQTVPCLRGLGIEIPEPPTREEFITSGGAWGAIDSIFTPFVSPERVARATALCGTGAAPFAG